MTIKNLVMTLGILGLFMFSIISFISLTQIGSDVENPITNNDLINESFGDLATNLASTEAVNASDNFGQVTPTQEIRLEVSSIVNPTKIAKSIILGMWNVFIKLPQSILGVSPIVASIISSILLIFIIIGMWAIWKGVIPS